LSQDFDFLEFTFCSVWMEKPSAGNYLEEKQNGQKKENKEVFTILKEIKEILQEIKTILQEEEEDFEED